ncbi:MAG: glycosyltransferase 87 family protein [Patescibacteria group bacterium]
MLTPKHAHSAFFAASLVFLFLFIFWLFYILPASPKMLGRDFLSYYIGANIVKNGEIRRIYDLPTQLSYQNALSGVVASKVLPYRALVVSSFIYMPFTFMSLISAYKYFILFQFISVAICVYCLVKDLGTKPLPLILLLMHPVLWINYYQGQPSLLLLLFLLLSVSQFRKGKRLFAGILLSLVLLKPQFFPLVIFMNILASDRRFLIGSLLSGFFLFFFNLFLYGLDFIKDYIVFLQLTETPYYGSHLGASFSIKSVVELVGVLFRKDFSVLFIPINTIIVCVVGIMLFLNKERIKGFGEKLGLCILLSIPLGMHLLNHDLVLLILPVCVFVADINLERQGVFFWTVYFITSIYFIINFAVLIDTSVVGLVPLLVFLYFYVRKYYISNKTS